MYSAHEHSTVTISHGPCSRYHGRASWAWRTAGHQPSPSQLPFRLFYFPDLRMVATATLASTTDMIATKTGNALPDYTGNSHDSIRCEPRAADSHRWERAAPLANWISSSSFPFIALRSRSSRRIRCHRSRYRCRVCREISRRLLQGREIIRRLNQPRQLPQQCNR